MPGLFLSVLLSAPISTLAILAVKYTVLASRLRGRAFFQFSILDLIAFVVSLIPSDVTAARIISGNSALVWENAFTCGLLLATQMLGAVLGKSKFELARLNAGQPPSHSHVYIACGSVFGAFMFVLTQIVWLWIR